MDSFMCVVKAKAVTRGPKHHFFGYYNVPPWDITGRYIVAMEVDFCTRSPQPGDVARIGLINSAKGYAWRHLAETRTWNWQQGCMLQWLRDKMPDASGETTPSFTGQDRFPKEYLKICETNTC